MSQQFEVPLGEVNEWLDVLRQYQREPLESFLEGSTPEAAAQRWLGMTGSPNIVPFGGEHDPKPFWDRFVSEFRRFVCDETAYVEEKRQLRSEGQVSKVLLVSAVSAALGAALGSAATLLAPAVALLLFTVGKMGLNAYCAV